MSFLFQSITLLGLSGHSLVPPLNPADLVPLLDRVRLTSGQCQCNITCKCSAQIATCTQCTCSVLPTASANFVSGL